MTIAEPQIDDTKEKVEDNFSRLEHLEHLEHSSHLEQCL